MIYNTRYLPNYVNVFLPAFGADMVEINYGKTGLFSYAQPFIVKYPLNDDLAIETYTDDIFGVDMAFYKSYITYKDGIGYKNIIVNPNPFDVGPMAELDYSKPQLLCDSLVTDIDLVKRYDGKINLYAANSSLKDQSIDISISTLCKSFTRHFHNKPLVLDCIDKETGNSLNCWDDLEMVVYFCPDKTTELVADCFQSKGDGYTGSYLKNSKIYFSNNNISNVKDVFACQQKKYNGTNLLDFDFSE